MAVVDSLRLVGILDRADPKDPHTMRRAREALEAGLPALMLRDRERSDEELLSLGTGLRKLAEKTGAKLLVNRRPALVRAIGADGIHVGREDALPSQLREEIGRKVLVGYSAHAEEEALGALRAGCDYVTYSPVFTTPSKAQILEPLGVVAVRELCERAEGPIVALGGIAMGNLDAVLDTGVSGVAAIRAVFGLEVDPGPAVRKMLGRIDDRRRFSRRP